MNGMFIGLLALFIGFAVLMAVWGRWRRQMGGGFGPTERADGSMTVGPTGYPEEMKGSGKVITPNDNKAAKM
jgi:hypothetical protein